MIMAGGYLQIVNTVFFNLLYKKNKKEKLKIKKIRLRNLRRCSFFNIKSSVKYRYKFQWFC